MSQSGVWSKNVNQYDARPAGRHRGLSGGAGGRVCGPGCRRRGAGADTPLTGPGRGPHPAPLSRSATAPPATTSSCCASRWRITKFETQPADENPGSSLRVSLHQPGYSQDSSSMTPSRSRHCYRAPQLTDRWLHGYRRVGRRCWASPSLNPYPTRSIEVNAIPHASVLCTCCSCN